MDSDSGLGFVSFFSGALGLDLGLERAGLRPLAVNEFDPIACQTIRRNRPNVLLYDTDIRGLSAERVLRDCGVSVGELFLVCGGPPCQAFSTAGKRLGLNDERGNVFLHFVDLVGQMRPKYVVIENVRGLLSAPLSHRPHSMRGEGHPSLKDDEMPGGALRHIVGMLGDYGYAVCFNLYNTANFGVPQIRERIILFGSREGGQVPDLVPTHDEFGRRGLPVWRTFKEAVEGLPIQQEHLRFPEKRLRYYRMLRPGENWRDLPEALQKEAMGRSYYSGGGKTGFYRRLAWDKPSPTMVTCPTMPATDLGHPTEDRPLSVQEYARVQTFPDDWQFAGNLMERYRQIGNAVPVVFGEAVGRHLLAHDRGEALDRSAAMRVALSRYRNTDYNSWSATVGRKREGEQLPLM